MPMAGLLMGTEGSELRGREVLSEMLSPVRTEGMHMEGEAAALKRKTAPLLRRRYPEKKERQRVLFFRSGLGFFFFVGQLEHCKAGHSFRQATT